MLILNAADFMGLLEILFKHEMEIARTRGPLPASMEGGKQAAYETLRARCDTLSLPVTKGMTEYILKSSTREELAEAFRQIGRTMHQELRHRHFYEPEAKYYQYLFEPELFGRTIFRNFPSANEDIFEAGMCLALERATACVMHLMRVLEVGLTALAKKLGIAPQNDWGRYLGAIEKELKVRYETAGARTPDEQFYSATAFNFDQLRRAWRNPTMHVENSYSPERAKEILESVRSFMIHLAENGLRE